MKTSLRLVLLLAVILPMGCSNTQDSAGGSGDGGGGGGGGNQGTNGARLVLPRERSVRSLRSLAEVLSRQTNVPLTDTNVALALEDVQVVLGTRTTNAASNRTLQATLELVYPFCTGAWNSEYASRNSQPVLAPQRIYTAIVLYDNPSQVVTSVEQFFLQRVYSRFMGVVPEGEVLTALSTSSAEVKATMPNTLDGLKNWAIMICAMVAAGLKSTTY